MKKQLNANQLFKYLSEISKHHDLKNIKVNYRYDYDSDVEIIRSVEEDLFDELTNQIPTSICLITDNRQDKKEWNSESKTQINSEKNRTIAFNELVTLFDICDFLENNGENKMAKKMRKTLNNIQKFIIKPLN